MPQRTHDPETFTRQLRLPDHPAYPSTDTITIRQQPNWPRDRHPKTPETKE